MPNFLTGDGGPGNRFFYGEGVARIRDALPVQNGTLEAAFVCNVVARDHGGAPSRRTSCSTGTACSASDHEIDAGNVRAFANEHNVVFCATKWAGMSEDDIGNAARTLGRDRQLPDRSPTACSRACSTRSSSAG